MKTSVVIITHNRPKLLLLTLKSLLNQTVPPNEVVIFDDASNTSIVNLIENFISRYRSIKIPIRVIRSNNEIGLGAARSIAAKNTTGDIIIFLDDDVIAFENLIGSYIKAFENSCDIVAGICYPLYVGLFNNGLPWWWNDKILGGIVAVRNDVIYYSRKNVNPQDYVFGCNFAIRRNVLEALKGFKPWLGRRGGLLLSGEEWDLCSRAVMKGFKICMSINSIVYHIIHVSKINSRRILNLSRDLGRTRCLLAYEGVLHRNFPKYLIRTLGATIKDIIEFTLTLLLINYALTMSRIFNFLLHLNTILLCKDAICGKWCESGHE